MSFICFVKGFCIDIKSVIADLLDHLRSALFHNKATYHFRVLERHNNGIDYDDIRPVYCVLVTEAGLSLCVNVEQEGSRRFLRAFLKKSFLSHLRRMLVRNVSKVKEESCFP